jgi:putative restriction endonuclease
MRTSDTLNVGVRYSREDLKTLFDIKDATINTGIFRPKNHDSIWLFVTKNKTPDRVQYHDELRGDDLFIDGQTSGRKDNLLIEHEQMGLEILLFYREEKYESANAAFRYEGRFKYVGHRGSRPAHFHLGRV